MIQHSEALDLKGSLLDDAESSTKARRVAMNRPADDALLFHHELSGSIHHLTSIWGFLSGSGEETIGTAPRLRYGGDSALLHDML
jgi:hypothetical protein